MLILMITGLISCEIFDPASDSALLNDQIVTLKGKPGYDTYKTTGFVEVLWKGADKGGNMGNKPDSLLCFLEFNAHEASIINPAKGEIAYRVLQPDSTLHREIKADVFGVYVDPVVKKAWVVATVVSDTKGCNGNGSGGHDTGCSSGGHDDTGGGCGDDDTSHDGGCSHDDGSTDTGGMPGDTGSDGGCEHDDTGGTTGDPGSDTGCEHDDTGGTTTGDTGSDTGCDHDDTGDTTHDDSGGCGGDTGGGGSPGGADKGNPLSGKNCRLGQIIALKMHDGGSPGMFNDGVTWKWFSPTGTMVPAIDNLEEWPHLCKKTIIGGNLTVHN